MRTRRRDTNIPIFHGDVRTGCLPLLFLFFTFVSFVVIYNANDPAHDPGMLKGRNSWSLRKFARIMPGVA